MSFAFGGPHWRKMLSVDLEVFFWLGVLGLVGFHFFSAIFFPSFFFFLSFFLSFCLF